MKGNTHDRRPEETRRRRRAARTAPCRAGRTRRPCALHAAAVAVILAIVPWLGGSAAFGQELPLVAQIPPGALEPATAGAVDSTAWLPDSLSWETEAPSAGADSLGIEADSIVTPLTPPGALPPSKPRETTSAPGASTGGGAVVPASPRPRGALPKAATGVYFGYPSWVGAMIVAPADGVAAFRTGITALPEIGILWTPGVEVRFREVAGTYAVDGPYGYGNLFLGRSWMENRDRDYTGMECGLGYRWILADRRGYRWIAALEGGGYWRSSSAWPMRPSLRFSWLLVE